ncbi:MAG: class I SAM-dependent methyltransferase, partial [Omnitrophica bacterium]|nr:class I SAM-dependent methyltransferase [Candidatus Omnitrophota bacterium]
MKRIFEESKIISGFKEVIGYDRELRVYYLWLCWPHIKNVLKSVKEIRKQGKKQISILDMGCGTGRVCIGIAKRAGSNCKIYGVDLSENMLEVASKNAKQEKVEDKIVFRNADALKLEFEDNYFDIVSSSNMLHHQEDPGPLLMEMRRLVNDR